MGIKDGNLRIVAARPAMGKTTLILNEAIDISMRGGNVLIFSLEMTKEELTDKILSCVSGINLRNIQTGDFEDDDHPKIQVGYSKVKINNLNIVDKSGLNINHLSNIAKKFNRTKKLDAIYIDYLQLVRADTQNRFEEISEVSRRLKGLAKDLNVPVIALSQLSRKVEERADKRPMMSDLRESGQIEQDADIIQFIYRDDYYLKDKSSFPNVAEIITSKFRGGSVGSDYLGCELDKSRFVNLDYVPQPKPQEEEYRPYGRK
jgi:replicative DNA helicase